MSDEMLELKPDVMRADRLPPSSETRDQIDRVLRTGGVRSVFQPIVELQSGSVVGYEALARGPAGTPLERPDNLFDAARRAGRLVDLDLACRRSAVATASTAGLAPGLTLFVNVEPEAIDVALPDVSDDLVPGRPLPRVVVEVTERALVRRPAAVLEGVKRIRDLGFGIALDDVGADRHSLALMPFVRPDVVKLDLALVQARPNREVAEIVNAVSAECERTGAIIVAEGIETEEHASTALAMGAALGQGWFFGRPGDLPPTPAETASFPISPRPHPAIHSTPVEVVERARPLRRASKRHLLAISRHLEEQALGLGDAGVVLAGFQKVDRFFGVSRARYETLARDAAFVGVFGVGMGDSPARGVRGAALDGDDPFVDEWDLAVVSPHFSALLAARDLGDAGPEADRRFDFAVTYDRDLVVEAAATLMGRIAPLRAPL